MRLGSELDLGQKRGEREDAWVRGLVVSLCQPRESRSSFGGDCREAGSAVGRLTMIGGATVLSVPPIVTFTGTVTFGGKTVSKALNPTSVQALTAALYGTRLDVPLFPRSPICTQR